MIPTLDQMVQDFGDPLLQPPKRNDMNNYDLCRKKHNEKGQSTIEFLTSIIFVLGMFYTFIQLAFNATDGFYVHYATFMASRTYLVADSNSINAESVDNFAKAMAEETFKNLKVSAFGYDLSGLKFNLQSQVGSGLSVLYLGAIFTFKQNLSPVPFISNLEMTLTSESFLGKEPSKQECVERIGKAMEKAKSGVFNDFILHTFFDNGC